MLNTRKQPFVKRLQTRQGLESVPAHILGLQDPRLEHGEGILDISPVAQPEASVPQLLPEWHLKPGANVLKAIHNVAAACQKNAGLA